MPSLKKLIEQLKSEFPQESVLLKYFDFSTLSSPLTPQPKYLYRGERTIAWATSMTTYSRNLKDHPDFREINHWISGHQLETAEPLNSYALYPFLKYALWTTEEERKNKLVEIYVNGIMQHYGFDTSLLDVTSNIGVAASFAVNGRLGEMGQIMVLETKNVEDQYFDLTDMFGRRAKLQSAYVLYGSPALDLKGQQFSMLYQPSWHRFTLTDNDKKEFYNPELLRPDGDDVAEHILMWYETHVLNNQDISQAVRDYFQGITKQFDT